MGGQMRHCLSPQWACSSWSRCLLGGTRLNSHLCYSLGSISRATSFLGIPSQMHLRLRSIPLQPSARPSEEVTVLRVSLLPALVHSVMTSDRGVGPRSATYWLHDFEAPYSAAYQPCPRVLPAHSQPSQGGAKSALISPCAWDAGQVQGPGEEAGRAGSGLHQAVPAWSATDWADIPSTSQPLDRLLSLHGPIQAVSLNVCANIPTPAHACKSWAAFPF